MPARQLVEHEPAGVVAGPLVLASRIAEARDEQIQRRGALAPTEEAHLALVGALLVRSPPGRGFLRLRREPPRPPAARRPRAARPLRAPRPPRAPARR